MRRVKPFAATMRIHAGRGRKAARNCGDCCAPAQGPGAPAQGPGAPRCGPCAAACRTWPRPGPSARHQVPTTRRRLNHHLKRHMMRAPAPTDACATHLTTLRRRCRGRPGARPPGRDRRRERLRRAGRARPVARRNGLQRPPVLRTCRERPQAPERRVCAAAIPRATHGYRPLRRPVPFTGPIAMPRDQARDHGSRGPAASRRSGCPAADRPGRRRTMGPYRRQGEGARPCVPMPASRIRTARGCS